MKPQGEKYNRTPAEHDQAEVDWDQEAYELDLKMAEDRQKDKWGWVFGATWEPLKKQSLPPM